MINLKGITEFEWKDSIIEKLHYKHSVDYLECEEIFFNKPLIQGTDKTHSAKHDEQNFVIGHTNAGRILTAIFKVTENGKIFVISSRDASKTERSIYEKFKEKIKDNSPIQKRRRGM